MVFEGEIEDGAGPGLEIESVAAGARDSRCVLDRSILRFISMAAPKFSVALFTNRGAKIASGPVEENKYMGRARSPPTHGRK